MAGQPRLQQFSQADIDKLRQNPDNIVMSHVESKNEIVTHMFTNVFIQEQVLNMRAMFEQYLVDYPRYSEDTIREKVLASVASKENSWQMLWQTRPKVFGPTLKKFTTPDEKKMYDVLLKCLELEVLRENGIVRTSGEIEEYWKSVGLEKEMNPMKYALDKINSV